MNDKDKELLAQFHHTISEQLNSRLSESPKFFGLLIVVSTGYGYVLSNPGLCKQKLLLALASLLSYVAVLWASWYLAALGYAFRFLQNVQHCIEHEIGWEKYTPLPEDERRTGKPPWPPTSFDDNFWLLPGIYHAHVAGLGILLLIIGVAFESYAWNLWQSCCLRCLLTAVNACTILAGLLFIWRINRHYLGRFAAKRNPCADEIPKTQSQL